MFLEHKHLYRQTYNKGEYPGKDFMVPFGKAALRRDGDRRARRHLGRARAALARRRAAGGEAGHRRRRCSTCGRSSPYDWEAIADARQATNRVIVAHEDQLTCGFGAEIAARIAGELFEYLDAPVRRVAALDTPVAYCPDLEEAILPQTADILAAIHETAAY